MVSYKDYFKPVFTPKKKKEEEPVNPITPPSKTIPTKNISNTSSKKSSDGGVKVLRDTDTGELSGIKTPDGRTLLGLKPRDVRQLSEKYVANTTAPAGTQFADELATQERIKAQEEAMMHNIPSIREEAIDITQDTPIYPSYDPITKTWSDPTTASVIKNAKDQANMNKIPVLNILGKITGALPNEVAGVSTGTIKKLILSIGKDNEEFRRYINDYSNSQNIDDINNEIVTSNTEIAVAKDLSKDFRYASEAQALYEAALARKRRAYNNYRIIADTSPKEFLKVKTQMIELETYFSTQKVKDDATINQNLYDARLNPMVR